MTQEETSYTLIDVVGDMINRAGRCGMALDSADAMDIYMGVPPEDQPSISWETLEALLLPVTFL